MVFLLSITKSHSCVGAISYLVTDEYNRNVLTNSDQIPVPVRCIFVCYSRRDVEHNNGTITLKNKNIGYYSV